MLQKRKESVWMEFSLLLAALLFLGVAVVRLREGPSLARGGNGALTAEDRAAFRGPASAPESLLRDVASADNNFDLGCLNGLEEKHLTTKANYVRLNAQACKPTGEVRLWREGESVLLFRKEKNITTSYFGLAAGENILEFEWQGGKRRVVLHKDQKPME